MRLYSLVKNVTLTMICLVLIIPSVIYLYLPLLGADNSYMVLSGSMRPALCPGDLVIVKAMDPASINVGDIVTFKSETGVFTHRVFEKKTENGVILFITKGDANEDPDPAYFDASQLIGRVVLVVPFRHLYTPYGFLSLVLAPTALIIGKQMHRIYDATKRRNRKELIRWRRKNRKSSVLETSTLLLALILVASTTRIMTPFIWVGSRSYFSDTETVWGLFSAGRWIITATVDIKPDTLNLKSEGEWTTVYVYIEQTEYDANKIVVSTVLLEGQIPAEWGEVQEDGRLMVKFDRASVIDYLISKGYKDGDTATLTVTGMFLDGTRFEGSDTIKVAS